jgi:hypothetical protein
MKRFALNKIKIAKLVNLQTIKGGVDTPSGNSIYPDQCTDITSDDCITDDCATGGTMPCTNTATNGELTSNPVGTGTTATEV